MGGFPSFSRVRSQMLSSKAVVRSLRTPCRVFPLLDHRSEVCVIFFWFFCCRQAVQPSSRTGAGSR